MEQSKTAESYAIFRTATGGKQYQAQIGKTVEVEKLNGQPGEEIIFEQVLLRRTVDPSGQAVVEVGQPYVKHAVKASIIKHERGNKIIVFHFKRRKGYKRKSGHRQTYTILRITAL